jgi:flagellar protein FlaI
VPQLLLPYSQEKNKCDTRGNISHIINALPKEAQELVQKNPHLYYYLHLIPVNEVGIPQFHQKLDRKMSSNKNPNMIYPVKSGIFTHILHDINDGRNTYIPIEPTMGQNLEKLMEEIERKLLIMADFLSLNVLSTDEEKKAMILQCLSRICTVSAGPVKGPSKNPISMNLFKSGFLSSKTMHKNPLDINIKPIVISPAQLNAAKYLIIRDKIGLGHLDPIVSDKYVEDISCSGMGPVFVEHKIFKSLKTVVDFPTHEDLDAFVMRLAERIKKPVSVHSPIVDATLPDGSRINIVYGRDVSKRGSNFTIRKFSETPLSILELVEMGTLDFKMAAYLSIMLGEGMNLFVCGETASGKTTTMNAITTFIPPNAKIVSIEDTPELQVPHKNWIREVVRMGKETDGNIGMFDLLKAALRQRPNEIIIGEIRGAEGAIAFQAMQTGHSVMATFHAASVERLIQRLTGDPINVPKSYIDNLNIAVIQSAVKLPSGHVGRRMLSISEIVGFDAVTQSFLFVEVFRWDSITDTFEFTGNNNSYLLEYKIAPKLGIPLHQKHRIYAQIDRRAKILEKLQKQGVKSFYDLLQVLAKAQKEGLF